MKTVRKIISVLLAFVLVAGMMPSVALAAVSDTDIAYAVTGGNIYFDAESGTITGGDSKVTSIVIPHDINGVEVTSVAGNAFSRHDYLESVVIPSNVTTLGQGAFQICPRLKTVDTASNYIGNDAFAGCTSLSNLTLREGVKTIGIDAFAGCDSLTEVTIPSTVSSIRGRAFLGCENLKKATFLGEDPMWESNIFATSEYADGKDYPDGFQIYCYASKWSPSVNSYFYNIPCVYMDESGNGDDGAAGSGSSTVQFNGSTYQYFSDKVSWIEAKEACEKLGGHLVAITSAEEQAFLDSKWGSYWIGATDEASEGEWVWVSGEVFSFANWTAGEPNNDYNGTEHYAMAGDNGRWDDRRLKNDAGGAGCAYVCEWDGTTVERVNFATDRWSFENQSTEIAKKIYTRLYGTVLGDKLYNKDTSHGTGGQCYGMAATTASINEKLPAVSTFGKNYLVDVGLSDSSSQIGMTAEDFIKYGYLLQYSDGITQEKSNTANDLDRLYAAVTSFQNGAGEPIVIGIRGDVGSSADCGHALYPLRVGKETSTACEIIVNDSNYPSAERTLVLQKNNGKFSGWSYNIFDSVIWGSDYPNGRIYYSTPALLLYYVGYYYNEEYGDNALVESDYILLSSDADEFAVQSGEKVEYVDTEYSGSDWLMPIMTESGTSEIEGIYWVNTEGSVEISELADEAEISLTSDSLGIDVAVPAGTEMSIDMSSIGAETAELELPANSSFELTYSEENGDFVDSITVSGAASGTVQSTRTESGILLVGANDITVSAEVEGVTQTKSFTDISNGTAELVVTQIGSGIDITLASISAIGVSVEPASATLTTVDETKNLTATISPSDATNQTVTWTSSNPSVATVDSNGTVTAVSNGTAIITATTEDGGFTAECLVTVEIPVAVSGVSVTPTEVTLTSVGETANLTATVSPDEATNKSVKWTSNDETVATVSETGVVTAVAAGTATITATTEDGDHTAACVVTVAIESVEPPEGGDDTDPPEGDNNPEGGDKPEGGDTPEGGGANTPDVDDPDDNQPGDTNPPSGGDNPEDGNNPPEGGDSGSGGEDDDSSNDSDNENGGSENDGGDGGSSAGSGNAGDSGGTGSGSTGSGNAGSSGGTGSAGNTNSGGNAGGNTGGSAAPGGNTDAGAAGDSGVGGGTNVSVEGDSAEGETGTDEPWINPFTDVAEGAWYYGAVEYVARNGIMTGYDETTFAPDDELSRAMLAQILYNLEGRPETSSSNAFGDVIDGAWYVEAVAWAAEQGYMEGHGKGKFGPDDPITREQVATVLYRYVMQNGHDVTARGDLSAFADADTVSEWARDALEWAVAVGLMQGYNGMLTPADTATRAEIATLLQRFLESIAM